MATCLLGLGSNLGDREATLRAAIAEITALPNVQLVRHSDWHRSMPVGGPSGQGEFLNAAAVIETTIAPLPLLDEFHDIETRHGRQPAALWSPRPLDIDLLLYGNEVTETEMLTLPHPRMSFRRFVLEPAVQIAPKMLHPVIGWTVERLLLHLNTASDHVALLSPDTNVRQRLSDSLQEHFGGQLVDRPTFATAEHHWPPSFATWLAFKTLPLPLEEGRGEGDLPSALPYAAAAFPKLTILIDSPFATPAAKLQWSTIVRQPGRGPTLRMQPSDPSQIDQEAFAAIEAVWPDLGPSNVNRLESKESPHPG